VFNNNRITEKKLTTKFGNEKVTEKIEKEIEEKKKILYIGRRKGADSSCPTSPPICEILVRDVVNGFNLQCEL
jgi:hypothetical protein